MKLRKLIIYDIDYKPLVKGLELYFPKNEENYISANCFIGINGSGKSQTLEIIAEIFLFLENVFRIENKKNNLFSPFGFRIEYEIFKDNIEYLVIFDCQEIKTKEKDIHIEIYKRNDVEFLPIDIVNVNLYDFLPNKIIGYSSGDNETISLPFDSYYDEYAEYTYLRAFGKVSGNDYEPNLYFMNYNTNLGIAISSLIFREDIPNIDSILKVLEIDDLISFQITIQTLPPQSPNKSKGGVILTEELEEWKNKLIKLADKPFYDEKHKKHILKYNLDKVTRAAFKSNFSNAFELYTCLYKLELLNNLIVDKSTKEKIKKERKARRLLTKMPMVSDVNKVLSYSQLKLKLNNGNEVDYLSLSDGEHQFLNVFGTILMISQNNCLFLLDEPETHFNPKWRRTFISTLKEITINRKQDMIITTHSPFVVSDCKNENVYIFKRENETVSIKNPQKKTYGASFDNILDMAFDIKIPISKDSLDEIEELNKNNDPNEISDKLEDYGESIEKNKLLSRIILLNSKENL
jgi:restriction system-associated AAA family ATPase